MTTLGMKGGDLLRTKLEDIARKAENAELLRVGFLEGATYPDGTPVALVAAVNEYGNPAKNQPPRPFFRQMIAAKSPGWGASMAKLMKTSGFDADKTLNLMGEGIRGQLQGSINGFSSVPLAPSTIAAKGFDKQLIDTSVMLKSVTFDVVKVGS
jgi:hypothetical protein